jgi:hypothetical protein
MHPENIRAILKDATEWRSKARERGADPLTLAQLESAWRTILELYDRGAMDDWYPNRKKPTG